jgi:hypothetical protein
MNEKIKNFREVMHNSMIKNYEKNGYLAPIFFVYMSDSNMAMGRIPNALLTPENKNILGTLIKNTLSENPLIIAAGLILPAYGLEVRKDSEMLNLVLNGDLDMQDIKEKHDIIIMIFSTPEKEEVFAYYVDDSTKTILTKFGESDFVGYSGIFSNLFTWNKN